MFEVVREKPAYAGLEHRITVDRLVLGRTILETL